MSTDIPRAPRGLGSSGKSLWRAVLTDYALDQHETSILTQACRVADACDKLQGIVDAGYLGESIVAKPDQEHAIVRVVGGVCQGRRGESVPSVAPQAIRNPTERLSRGSSAPRTRLEH